MATAPTYPVEDKATGGTFVEHADGKKAGRVDSPLSDEDTDPELSSMNEKALVRKIDYRLVPWLSLVSFPLAAFYSPVCVDKLTQIRSKALSTLLPRPNEVSQTLLACGAPDPLDPPQHRQRSPFRKYSCCK